MIDHVFCANYDTFRIAKLRCPLFFQLASYFRDKIFTKTFYRYILILLRVNDLFLLNFINNQPFKNILVSFCIISIMLFYLGFTNVFWFLHTWRVKRLLTFFVYKTLWEIALTRSVRHSVLKTIYHYILTSFCFNRI